MSEDDRPITDELNTGGLNEALPHVYGDLKRLSAKALKGERRNHTLSPTALAHELYLRLLKLRRTSWEHRGQFFKFVKDSLRYILLDYARRRRADRRGGGWTRINHDLDQLPDDNLNLNEWQLQEILLSIQAKDPQLARLIDLKFLGVSEDQIARELKISTATVSRRWRFATRLLATALKGE
jgi:RNA polymerase sigma-70 factor (ECF subfamily)